jgi:conjugal transfer pilin signal peptidase TrbI
MRGRLLQEFQVNLKKTPSSWWLKALGAVLCMYACGALFASRYSLNFDDQTVKCIPGKTWYLVDKSDVEPQRGELYLFSSPNLEPFYPAGTKMIKYLRGLPGDKIQINAQDNILINGDLIASGLEHAETLNRPASSFRGSTTLIDERYWVMGTSSASFDSRYWGAIKKSDILGHAYPLF